MKVLNKKDISHMPPNTVYVGRGSKWGNPFKISKVLDRYAVIQLYKAWAWQMADDQKNLDNGDWLRELRGKDLLCYCAPLPCHADILLEMLEQ